MSDRRLPAVLIVVFMAAAICFRLMHLSSMPGISGDEGWWGVQATAWLEGRLYERYTTSGNPTDMFFLIPVALVHAIAPPTFATVRAVPVVANLLVLPIGFWLVRRLYGSSTAWIHTVALGVMPTAIAHGRVCQDPSQSVLWTGIVIYTALLGVKDRKRAWLCLGAALLVFPVVVWTHPTNVFVAPFLLLPFVAAVYPLLPATRRGRAILFLTAGILGVVGLSLAMVALRRVEAYPLLDKPWLSIASARLIDGKQWFEFAANNARLFNGVTVYHYFSGARPATFPYDAGFVVVTGTALAGLIVAPATRRSALDSGLLAACALVWLGLYAFAGPQALRPHAERWGLCLIVPGTLVVSRGIAVWIERAPKLRWLTIASATLVAASLLTSFYANYFREFATTGGRSHPTYITAPTEPKRQALERILARTAGSGRVTIVTQQYWLYWPIAYLAMPYPGVKMIMGGDQAHLTGALQSGRVFVVEFAGTPELAAATTWIRDQGLRAERGTVRDASGRDHLEILEVTTVR